MNKHTKPHFKYSGGVYEAVYTGADPFKYNNGPDVTAIMLFSRQAMENLIGAYHWWKKRDQERARITFVMMLKRAEIYRVANPRGSSNWVVINNRILTNTGSRFVKAYLQSTIDKARRKNVKLKPAKHYLDMIASGYCRVSNNHHTVSRIDTPEWKYDLAVHHRPWNPDEVEVGEGSGDTYRRCISKDKISNLDPEIYKLFPGSSGGPDCYLPLTGAIANGQ